MCNYSICEKIYDDGTIGECRKDHTRDHNLTCLVEECAELTQACTKFIRGKGIYENLVEEIVDVMINLDIIMDEFNITEQQLYNYIVYKLDRYKERKLMGDFN